jgi:ADP-dependent NAD(P)H-hydrate dehydratase / NAD(P)H-hydrate epimerase
MNKHYPQTGSLIHPLPDSGNLFSAQQVKAIEMLFSKFHSKPTYQLMEKAALSVYQALVLHWPQAKKIVVVCGKGNNAGDGFLLAQLAIENNFDVDVLILSDPSKLEGDAEQAWQSLQRLSFNLVKSVDFNQYDVIIDAILGTGIKGEVRRSFAKVITKINQSTTPVLAIDLPSGVAADTGVVESVAVKAHVTLTMIGVKRGLVTANAPDYSGDIFVASLGITDPQSWLYPPQTGVHSKLIEFVKFPQIDKLLFKRRNTSHKGSNGHCLIIAGAKGMLGAAIIASRGCARSGAGLVSCRVECNAEMVTLSPPEVMANNLPLSELDSLSELLLKVDCCVIGPGLGCGDWAQQILASLTNTPAFLDKVKLFDADALNWLALNPNVDKYRILTPHPAEAARLLGISVAQVERDRYFASQKIAEKYGGICLLKGAGSIIADAEGNLCCCPVGNPGMASGGMGDLLSGIVGALLAQGFTLWNAVKIAVCVHGEAADRQATQANQYRGILATDLLTHLPRLLN